MTAEQKSVKRKRTDGTSVRSSKYWFEDGNIVLQAERTQYRVHRSYLARQSPIFADMFSTPQPPEEGEEVVEGCPVVHLQDSPRDITNLLKLMYNSMNLDVRSERTPVCNLLVATMMRLGRKYSFENFWDEGLHLLQQEYPATLAQWDDIYEDMGRYRNRRRIQYDDSSVYDVIALAHEICIKSILPGAYLFVVGGHDLKEIQEGIEQFDSYRVNEPSNCLLGRERICNALMKHPLAWLHDGTIPSTNCKEPDTCLAKKNTATLSVLQEDVVSKMDYMITKGAVANLTAGLCKACTFSAKTSCQAGRNALWDLLPEYFGLNNPVWDV